MRQRVQVPFRTLVRVSDLRIFIIIDVFARLEPPTRSCSARGEPGGVSLVGKSPSGHFRRGPLPCGEQVGGSSCFRSWEHLGNNLPTEGQTKAFPRGNRTAGSWHFWSSGHAATAV